MTGCKICKQTKNGQNKFMNKTDEKDKAERNLKGAATKKLFLRLLNL